MCEGHNHGKMLAATVAVKKLSLIRDSSPDMYFRDVVRFSNTWVLKYGSEEKGS